MFWGHLFSEILDLLAVAFLALQGRNAILELQDFNLLLDIPRGGPGLL
jgi:hypothetical protein